MAAVVEFDVVVVGAGAAGMTGALTAARRGLRTVVIEKAAVVRRLGRALRGGDLGAEQRGDPRRRRAGHPGEGGHVPVARGRR